MLMANCDTELEPCLIPYKFPIITSNDDTTVNLAFKATKSSCQVQSSSKESATVAASTL